MIEIARQKELRDLVFPRDLIDQESSSVIRASLVILSVNDGNLHIYSPDSRGFHRTAQLYRKLASASM